MHLRKFHQVHMPHWSLTSSTLLKRTSMPGRLRAYFGMQKQLFYFRITNANLNNPRCNRLVEFMCSESPSDDAERRKIFIISTARTQEGGRKNGVRCVTVPVGEIFSRVFCFVFCPQKMKIQRHIWYRHACLYANFIKYICPTGANVIHFTKTDEHTRTIGGILRHAKATILFSHYKC